MKVQIFKYSKTAPLFRGEKLREIVGNYANRNEVNNMIEPAVKDLKAKHGSLVVAILTD